MCFSFSDKCRNTPVKELQYGIHTFLAGSRRWLFRSFSRSKCASHRLVSIVLFCFTGNLFDTLLVLTMCHKHDADMLWSVSKTQNSCDTMRTWDNVQLCTTKATSNHELKLYWWWAQYYVISGVDCVPLNRDTHKARRWIVQMKRLWSEICKILVGRNMSQDWWMGWNVVSVLLATLYST